MYENEYKERAYQAWKQWKEDPLRKDNILIALAEVLDVHPFDLLDEFNTRYEEGRDDLDKIRESTEELVLKYLKPSRMQKKVASEMTKEMLNLIDRTVAVMKCDEQ